MHLEKKVESDETFAHITLDSKAGALETNFTIKLETEGDTRDPSAVRRVVFVGKGWAKGLKKDAVLAEVETYPDATPKEIASRLGVVSKRYVQKIMKDKKTG
jgi:hypothetical protein